MIVALLRSHGLAAFASADDAGGVDPALAAQGVRVLVADEDEGPARELLAQAESVPKEPATLNRLQRWVVRLLGGGT